MAKENIVSLRLVFVYNANAGRLNGLIDSAHKLLSPDTYQCALCEITHGAFGERQAWKEFKASLPMPIAFYHKDEFERETGRKYAYPVILEQTAGGESVVLLDAARIAQCKSVPELASALNHSLRRQET